MTIRRWTLGFGKIVLMLALLPLVGCAGPRLGSRLLGRNQPSAAEEASYVAGQMPLPSQQAARPESVNIPPEGQYDARTVSDIRRRAGDFFMRPHPAGCSS